MSARTLRRLAALVVVSTATLGLSAVSVEPDPSARIAASGGCCLHW